MQITGRRLPVGTRLAALFLGYAMIVSGLVATTGLSASAAAPPTIMVSGSPDRSDAAALSGSTRSGMAYVFVATSVPGDSVTFVVDPGTPQERIFRDDRAPYDLAGTAADGTAHPLDLTSLGAGSHKVVAYYQKHNTRTDSKTTATFSVTETVETPPSDPVAPVDPIVPSDPIAPVPPSDEVVVEAAPGGLAAAVGKVRDANKNGRGVRLVLQPGLYRESLLLTPWASATAAPITIDGQGATISGADVLSSWSPVGDGTYRHHWPHNLGNQSDPWPALTYNRALLNREALFVGQAPYHVVDSAAALVPGTFLVDEVSDSVVVRPRGTDAGFAKAEVTVRTRTLLVEGHSNVTVRNLTLERSAGAVQEAAVGASASPNLTFDGVTVRQAAGKGMSIGGANGAHLRGVRFLDNGVSGFGAYKQTGIRMEDIELAGNNWRGAQVGFFGWEAGVKFGMTRDVVISGWYAHGNYSHGLWFDYDNRNVQVRGLVSAGNLGRGLFLEKNPGPITIEGADICNNGMSGISYARTDRVTLKDSKIFDNAGWQHLHTGDANPVTMPDGTVVHGNMLTIQNTTTRGDDWAQKDSMDKGWLFWQTRDEAAFWDSAVFSGNTWHHTQRSNPFRTSATWNDWSDYSVFAKKSRETGGRWADPGGLACSAPRPGTTVDYAVGW